MGLFVGWLFGGLSWWVAFRGVILGLLVCGI